MRISDWSSDVCSSDLGRKLRRVNDDRGGFNCIGGRGAKAREARAGKRGGTHVHSLFLCTETMDAGQRPGRKASEQGGRSSGRRRRGRAAMGTRFEIRGASGRDRGCQYVEVWVGAVSVKKKTVNRQ